MPILEVVRASVRGWLIVFVMLVSLWWGNELREPGWQYRDPFPVAASFGLFGVAWAIAVAGRLVWFADLYGAQPGDRIIHLGATERDLTRGTRHGLIGSAYNQTGRRTGWGQLNETNLARHLSRPGVHVARRLRATDRQ